MSISQAACGCMNRQQDFTLLACGVPVCVCKLARDPGWAPPPPPQLSSSPRSSHLPPALSIPPSPALPTSPPARSILHLLFPSLSELCPIPSPSSALHLTLHSRTISSSLGVPLQLSPPSASQYPAQSLHTPQGHMPIPVLRSPPDLPLALPT